jgi:hypothetical protein
MRFSPTLMAALSIQARAPEPAAAPAEPAAPAAAEPAKPTVANHIAQLREQLERGEGPLAELERAQLPAEPAAQPADGEPQGQPRDERGRFASADQDAGADAELDSGDGVSTDTDQETPDETLVVQLPPRRDGGDPLEIEVADQEVAEALRAAIRGGLRRDELNQRVSKIEEREQEIEFVRSSLRADPVGFLADHVPPEVRRETVRHFLATMDEADYEQIMGELAQWDSDPRERQLAAANAQLDRGKRREDAAFDASVSRNAVAIVNTVETLVPDDMDPEDAEDFRQYALGKLQDFVTAQNIEQLDPQEVPGLLARLRVLNRFGIEAPAANGNGNAAPAARARAAAPARQKPTPQEAQATSEQIRRATARRRAATAVAPAGAGAAPVRVQPPKGQSVIERIKWARENLVGQ